MVNSQIISFIAYFFSGIIICIVFDLFRSLRKGIKTSNTVTNVEDIIFWLITGILIIWFINVFSYGELRLYIFVAVILGAIVYFFTLSKYCISILLIIILAFKKIISIFLKFIGKPIYFFIINFKKIKKLKK